MTSRIVLILFLATWARPETAKYEANVFEKYAKVKRIDAERLMKIVTIRDYPEPSGVLFIPDDSTIIDVGDYEAVHPSHDFYAAMSCEFARWTMNKIFHFLKRSPEFYQNGFHDHRVYKKVFRRVFEKSMRYLAEIDPYIERFVNVLHNFANSNLLYAYYSDMAVLEVLVSLRVKIFFASSRGTLNADGSDTTKLSDGRVVRLIAEELNSLQRFLYTNCSAEPSNDAFRHSEFTGYWISEIGDANTGLDAIDGLLFNIRPLKLEPDRQNKCSVTQMLLENFVSPSSTDPVSYDIMQAEFTAHGREKTSMIIVLRLITEVYDIDLIYLYQYYVIAAIVKSLFYRMLKVVETNPKSIQIEQRIDNINAKLSKNIEEYPEFIVNSFRFLIEIWKSKGTLNAEHEAFRLSLEFIEIKNREIPSKDDTHTDPDVDYRMFNENAVVNLLTTINENIDDFKCFHRSTMIRSIKNEKYDNTFMEILKIHFLDHPAIYNDRMFEVCDFTLKMYSICYQALIYVNRCIENKEHSQKLNLFQRVMIEFNRVRNYILTVIVMKIDIVILRKMAFKIAIIMFKTRYEYNRIYYVERILNVVMIELKIFGTKYCESSDYNNFFINDYDLMELGNVKSIEEFANNFFKQFYKNYDKNWLLNNIQSNDFNYINIDYLYATHILNSKVFNSYEGIIIFYWKGRMRSVKQIYKNAVDFTLNSNDLYVLYDIYFKFIIAVIYYETREFIATGNFKQIELKCQEIKNYLTNFVNSIFPTYLHNLITDIKTLWDIPSKLIEDKTCADVNGCKLRDLTKVNEKVDRQFTKFCVEFRKPKTSWKFMNCWWERVSKEQFETINREMKVDVNNVMRYFSSLHMNILS